MKKALILYCLCASLQAEVLTVATSFVAPPLEFMKRQKPVGFEVEYLERIAEHLGYEVRFSEVAHADLLRTLQEGKCDLILGEITPGEGVVSTLPHHMTSVSVLIDGRFFSGDLKEARVAVLRGGVEETCAQRLLKKGEISSVVCYDYEALLSALADLTRGKVDALFALTPVASYLRYATPTLKLNGVLSDSSVPLVFYATRRELIEKFNEAQQHLQNDGTFRAIEEKWLF